MSHDRSTGGYTYPRILLTFVFAWLLLLACAPVSQAQSNGEYTFRQQSVINYGSYGPGDSVPVITMDALAANGFGQWTLTSTGNGSYDAGWYLLGNGLYKPSELYDSTDLTDHPGCISPGVVSHGDLDYTPTEPKATANLDGAAYYVWPDPSDRQSFVVEGFSTGDIDISIPAGFPSTSDSRNIIKNPISSFSVPTWTGSSGNTHDVSNDEADFRDNFDVVCDSGFLYIIWSSSVNPDTAFQEEIWATVIDLSTQTTVSGYPALVGAGIRPTIACDPRANRLESTPHFHASFLSGLSDGYDHIIFSQFDGTSETDIEPLTSEFYVPGIGDIDPYGFATHARVVMSSMEYHLEGDAVGVYAIASGILLFYDEIGWPASYIDGPLTQWAAYPLPPGSIGQPSDPPTVLDNPIITIADPYNNQDHGGGYWYGADTYHCLYQLDVLFPGSLTHRYPLCIVRNVNNGTYNVFPPFSWPSRGDTRLVLNQDASGVLENDPLPNTYLASTQGGWYVGAANQMGIHVHWPAIDSASGDTAHFYARDTSRTFDEDIDENTLVTDLCGFTDGTAHGGTVGAQVLPGKIMMLWVDPNYGESTLDITGNPRLYNSSAIWRPITSY